MAITGSGDINPALYALGGLGSALTLHDVKDGNNSVSESDATDTLVDVAGFNAGPQLGCHDRPRDTTGGPARAVPGHRLPLIVRTLKSRLGITPGRLFSLPCGSGDLQAGELQSDSPADDDRQPFRTYGWGIRFG